MFIFSLWKVQKLRVEPKKVPGKQQADEIISNAAVLYNAASLFKF